MSDKLFKGLRNFIFVLSIFSLMIYPEFHNMLANPVNLEGRPSVPVKHADLLAE